MGDEIEISGRTVEDALHVALEKLGAERDQVEVEIIKKGKSGIFGLRGEDARIRVSRIGLRLSNSACATVQGILTDLLKLLGITGYVKVISYESPIWLNVDGDDLGILIGRRGQTLSMLEYVVKVIAAEKLSQWLPIVIDIAGYKQRRRESLENLAVRLANKVRLTKRSVSLEPMPADERRYIHLKLAADPDVITQSTGDGSERKVVIMLKRK